VCSGQLYITNHAFVSQRDWVVESPPRFELPSTEDMPTLYLMYAAWGSSVGWAGLEPLSIIKNARRVCCWIVHQPTPDDLMSFCAEFISRGVGAQACHASQHRRKSRAACKVHTYIGSWDSLARRSPTTPFLASRSRGASAKRTKFTCGNWTSAFCQSIR